MIFLKFSHRFTNAISISGFLSIEEGAVFFDTQKRLRLLPVVFVVAEVCIRSGSTLHHTAADTIEFVSIEYSMPQVVSTVSAGSPMLSYPVSTVDTPAVRFQDSFH